MSTDSKKETKPTNSLFKTVCACIVICFLFAGAWLFGNQRGISEQESVHARSKAEEISAQAVIDELQSTLRETEIELGQARQAAIASASRAETFQRMLESEMSDSSGNIRDLALYRSIETAERPRLVEVESASLLTPGSLQLLVVQWQGRDRVDGQLQVSFKYTPADGVSAIESPGEASDSVTGSLIVDAEPISFDFRFFQRVDVPVPNDLNSAGLTPDSLEVRIFLSDERLNSSDKRIAWSELEIVD